MLVLEHFTHTQARVLTICKLENPNLIFDKARRGDRVYTVPDIAARDAQTLVEALKSAPVVEV